MNIIPIAWTTMDRETVGAHTDYNEHEHLEETDIDELAEFAGRACYESWDRPDPNTQTNEGYLEKILDHRHFSVLEHGSVTVYVTEVSRSFSHELVRHRHNSYSQLSQRFVDSSDVGMVLPVDSTPEEDEMLSELMDHAVDIYDVIAERRFARGQTRKEARQAARYALPNMTETKIVVTGNMRAWRELIEKRNDPGADKEIQLFARSMLVILKELAPNTFQDMG